MQGRTLSRQVYDTRLTTKASLTTNVILLSLDANRVYASIFNNSTSVLSIVLASAGAGDALLTAGRITVNIAAGGYFETPVDFVGEVIGKWVAANGAAEITEYR